MRRFVPFAPQAIQSKPIFSMVTTEGEALQLAESNILILGVSSRSRT